MTIQVEFTWLIGLALAFSGIYGTIAWRLMDTLVKRQDERLASVNEATNAKFDQVKQLFEKLASQSDRSSAMVQQLERDLAALRLEMMRDFTRREDHNQAIASIRVGLDNMSLRIEKALATGGRINE